jgi:hypothetical protein
MTRYQLTVEAENVPQSSVWTRWLRRRAHQVYVEITVTGGAQAHQKLGRTESCSAQRRVQWCKPIYIETDSSVYMPLSIRIVHESGSIVAEMTAEATTIYQSPGRQKIEKKNGVT